MDPHVDFVIPELEERNLNYEVICPDEFPLNLNLETEISNSFKRHTINKEDIEEIRSIWYRRPLFPKTNYKNKLANKLIQDEIKSYTSYFFNSMQDKFWVSFPPNIEISRNKILQLEYAVNKGMSIPKTLITTELSSFNEFYNDCKNKVIIKSISGCWYEIEGEDHLFFTNLVNENKLPDKKSLSISPCLFQEYVDKEIELRSTVMGNKVFTAAIYSQEKESSKIDWRIGSDIDMRHEIYKLPKKIEEGLISITKRFGLNFGAYDLILTPEGEHVFLELNPNGQWGWIQEKTGLPIKEALVDILEYGKN